MTKVELEKSDNADTHLFIEVGMRGGISYINKRYSKANNKYCPDYDRTKREKFITYLDMNNLYGKAMSGYLPYREFKLVEVNNETTNKVLNKSDNSLYVYFIVFDLEVPEELNDYHKDYPMTLVKIKIEDDMLAPYWSEIKRKYNNKSEGFNKLAPNLIPKNNYVVYYRDLKYYLSQRLILKKVHKILEFKQSAWIKPYIDFNTERRKEATNETDKYLFKLLINATYGKTMENMRKRFKIRIITNEKDFLKYVSKSTYIAYRKFGKNLVAIHEKKETVKLNKPIYVGMYKFYYDFVKKKYKNPKLLFTETDGLCIETEEDFYKIIHPNKKLFDISNFPKDSEYYCADNKKVPGKMKDEYGGRAIYDFTGTNQKCIQYVM